MLPAAALLVVIFVWLFVYIFDLILRTFASYPYLWFLDKSGLEVGKGQLRWITTVFNRLFYRWGTQRSAFARKWFNVGTYVSILCIIPAIAIMISTAYKQLTFNREDAAKIILQPAIPGVNLPISEILYYLFTLLICSVVHEAGHAVAAVKEGVKVYGFGFLLWLVFPAAYVDISTDQLQSVTPWQQLRIYCAGVWNNIVLTIVAVTVLLSLPVLSVPLYQQGVGVSIVAIQSNSPLIGPKGLEVGHVVVGINECPVNDYATWSSCIETGIAFEPHGLCIDAISLKSLEEPRDLVRLNNTGDCCLPTNRHGLCFEYTDRHTWKQEYACLPARRLIRDFSTYCNHTEHCIRHLSGDSVCVSHVGDTTSRFMQIHRRHVKDPVLFVGNPADLYYTATATNYVARTHLLSAFVPYAIDVLCRYIVAFSSALALLNVLPCYLLDGYHITHTLGEIMLSPIVRSPEKRKHITDTVVIGGTWLLALNIYLGIRSILV